MTYSFDTQPAATGRKKASVNRLTWARRSKLAAGERRGRGVSAELEAGIQADKFIFRATAHGPAARVRA